MSDTQPQKEIIYAFIDSQNLNLSIRDQGWKLDFAKFRKYMTDRFRTKKLFFFIGFVKENIGLYKHLKELGYTIIFKPTLKTKDEKVKGNVDAELVLHSMIEYGNYNKAIIISGDGDFHCLIEHLKNKNKLHKLIIPNKYKYSSLLRGFTDHIIFLNNTREKLEKR